MKKYKIILLLALNLSIGISFLPLTAKSETNFTTTKFSQSYYSNVQVYFFMYCGWKPIKLLPYDTACMKSYVKSFRMNNGFGHCYNCY
jgi:hypothetical protein